jgi:hypothetical protein
MAAALVLRFPGASIDDYFKVNQALDIDMKTGAGEWPDGLISHAAGEANGDLYVFEIWSSREAQGRFMEGRLARAMQDAGVILNPPEITWVDLVSYQTPGKVPA